MDVTVIIPTHDRLWCLPRAVESCRSLSLSVQIIVVDDGSTDGTSEWLAQQTDIQTLEGHGWGKPWAVNLANHYAEGKYVRYLDSDDWLNAEANERQFEVAENQCADVVVAGLEIYREDRLIESQDWLPTDDFIAQQLGETPGSHYSAFLFRREFVKDIPHRTSFPASDFASRDDRCFVLEVALRKPVIAVTANRTLCHRHHDRGRLQFQQSLRRDGTHIQQLYIYRQIVSLLDRGGELTDRRKRAAAKVLWPLAHWIAYTHPREACEVANWVYSLDPELSVPEKGLLGTLYRRIGFRNTERVLRIRRNLLALFRERQPTRT
jgi:glycosyltransferase involved in cell wall biosynthesis